MIVRAISLFALALGLTSIYGCSRAQTPSPDTVWEGVRSAIIYVRAENPEKGTDIEVRWSPAWISDSQRERLYWYGPDGDLLARVEIETDQRRGAVRLPLSDKAGDYRIVIPGYSFRKYEVRIPTRYPSVIEPEKLHFSMELPTGHTFWSGPLQRAKLKLKSHRNNATLSYSLDGRGAKNLSHQAVNKYRDHATVNLQGNGRQLKLDIGDGGKFSFWLDDAPNFFSQTKADWFEPRWQTGTVTFSVSKQTIGSTTKIGTYTEFAPLPADLKNLLNDVKPAIVHSYIFEDVMDRHRARDDANNRALYELGVQNSYGLLSRTIRDSLPKSTSESAAFLEQYIRRRFQLGLPLNTIAFVDEPNLRYRSFASYEAYHLALAKIVRRLEASLDMKLAIAAPESSRMVNGPTNEARRFQTGLDWTDKLLSRHWNTVDVISWHMWQYRYLEALDHFPETIEDVSDLNIQLARKFNARPKRLSISQTNLGSGPNTSTYQQNTHYASQWWASVVAQSIATGKLDSLIWFKAVDEGPYGKGLLMRQDGMLVRKPIADAMVFINRAVLPVTLKTSSSSHEIDLAAMTSSSGEVSILCVNKSRRDYSVLLDAQAYDFQSLGLLTDGRQINQSTLSSEQRSGTEPILLPAGAICNLRGRLRSHLR